MKRTAITRKTPLKAAQKPMPKRSAKRRSYYASAEGRAAIDHMRRVKLLPCVICGRPGPSDAHHVICGRYSARKASDLQVIPLCVAHHRYPHPEAIHTDKTAWEARNGPDHEYLAVVADMLAGEWTTTAGTME